MINKNIDNSRDFDWGKTSGRLCQNTGIFTQRKCMIKFCHTGLCLKGQKVLDLGTGTGVIPRNMYKYGAEFVGADISENQIEQAKLLSVQQNMNIEYYTSPVEELDFPENTFDVVTAFTCFFYFDHETLIKMIRKILKPNGHLLIGYLAWLPV